MISVINSLHMAKIEINNLIDVVSETINKVIKLVKEARVFQKDVVELDEIVEASPAERLESAVGMLRIPHLSIADALGVNANSIKRRREKNPDAIIEELAWIEDLSDSEFTRLTHALVRNSIHADDEIIRKAIPKRQTLEELLAESAKIIAETDQMISTL